MMGGNGRNEGFMGEGMGRKLGKGERGESRSVT